ncbi:DUF859 family phage minor structural protein [Gryllotalpicola koreensis]|uniref:Phage tail collar domain-containing protein n=1 Tax=Gryllotalpicola koreensis TaxID=993086 RepID=A0ABP8A2Y0_9MICO
MAQATGSNGNVQFILTINEIDTDPANNQSTVQWQLTGQDTAGKSWSGTACSGDVSVDGTSHPYSYSWSSPNTSVRILSAGTQVINHNADGTKSFTASFSFDGIPNSSIGSASGSTPVYLTTLPRASSWGTVPSFTAGSASTMTVSKKASSFTSTITYNFGGTTGTIVSKSSASSISWTPPVSLLSKIPNATSGTGTLTLTTFSGSTQIGSAVTHSFTLNAAASAVPSVGSWTIDENDSTVTSILGDAAGAAFVQGKSKVHVTATNPAGYQGSTVKTVAVYVGSVSTTVNGADATVDLVPTASGSVTVTVKVTDSRGRTATSTQSITVLPYAAPSVGSVSAKRVNTDGSPNDEGTTLSASVSGASVTSLSVGGVEKNSLTVAVDVAPGGSTTFTQVVAQTPSGLSFTGALLTSDSYATDSSWAVRVRVIDKFGTSAASLKVPTSTIFMHWDGSAGVGIGQYREHGMLDVAGDIYSSGVNIAPVGAITMYAAASAPTGWLSCNGAAVSRAAYPALFALIGTSYGAGDGSTTFNVPALGGKMPMGRLAGTYDVGGTGGEATHVLTVAEMPSHTHTQNSHNHSQNSHSHGQVVTNPGSGGTAARNDYNSDGGGLSYTQGVNTDAATATNNAATATNQNTGGGAAHNNLPPYLVVNFIIKAF